MLRVGLYRRVRSLLVERGYGADYTWSQNLRPPATPEALACEYTWVVVNSGMKNTVAHKIFDRVWPRLLEGRPLYPAAFGHRGKALAIGQTWDRRARHFSDLQAIGADTALLLAWCESLPWIGPITKFHLAKNLGADVAKPDRWLERLAAPSGETVDELCARLARASGDRIATVDLILWRACAIGLLVVDGRAISLASGGTKY
jgi:hypothetical protein